MYSFENIVLCGIFLFYILYITCKSITAITANKNSPFMYCLNITAECVCVFSQPPLEICRRLRFVLLPLAFPRKWAAHLALCPALSSCPRRRHAKGNSVWWKTGNSQWTCSQSCWTSHCVLQPKNRNHCYHFLVNVFYQLISSSPLHLLFLLICSLSVSV